MTNPLGISADDLAPGDIRSANFDWSDYVVSAIDSVGHPDFEAAYAPLWAEFGPADEMEQRAVLAKRMAWRTDQPVGGRRMRYELLLLRRGGEFAAAIDHSVVAGESGPVVVHVSHLLIAPPFRGSGLAGWLRAASLRLAISMAAGRPIVLAMEMEPKNDAFPDRLPRLRTAEGAGFLKVADFTYWQPDFRPPEAIDAAGGPVPLALSLVLRRVGAESETTLRGTELRHLANALYHVYAQTFRPADLFAATRATAVDEDRVYSLVAPTA